LVQCLVYLLRQQYDLGMDSGYGKVSQSRSSQSTGWRQHVHQPIPT